jgi:hypothetical protein
VEVFVDGGDIRLFTPPYQKIKEEVNIGGKQRDEKKQD